MLHNLNHLCFLTLAIFLVNADAAIPANLLLIVQPHTRGPKECFSMIETFNCICMNIVYGIICKRCDIIYMWETDCRLADRITEHIHSIRNNFYGFPVFTTF